MRTRFSISPSFIVSSGFNHLQLIHVNVSRCVDQVTNNRSKTPTPKVQRHFTDHHHFATTHSTCPPFPKFSFSRSPKARTAIPPTPASLVGCILRPYIITLNRIPSSTCTRWNSNHITDDVFFAFSRQIIRRCAQKNVENLILQRIIISFFFFFLSLREKRWKHVKV